MRAALGFVGLQAVLSLAGFGLLRWLGLLTGGLRAVVAGLGAAVVLGTVAVAVAVSILLVLGVPFTLGTALLVALLVAALGFWRGRGLSSTARAPSVRWTALLAVLVAAATVYALYGAQSLSTQPTLQDDARIWSLKGLALTYASGLPREIFLNPATTASHQVYPLLQPVIEALVNRSMGRLELDLFHGELWFLLVATLWAAAYLIWWRTHRPALEQPAIAVLVLLAVSPFVIDSVATGYADVTGSMLLGLGSLALGLWLEGGEDGHLWLGVLLLAGAANTKDEDTVGAVLVLLALGAVVAGVTRRRLWSWVAAAAAFALLIAPWRIWTAVHGLHDSVQPPLPRALDPVFVVDRFAHLQAVATAIVNQVVINYGWQASIFLAVCTLALIGGRARRLAAFYLLSFALLVVSLLWLYTTTSTSLGFLIPTSVYRTIDVFMMLTPFACAHVLTRLLGDWDWGALRPRVGTARGSSAGTPAR